MKGQLRSATLTERHNILCDGVFPRLFVRISIDPLALVIMHHS